MKASVELIRKTNSYCVAKRKERKKWNWIYGTVCVGVEDSSHKFKECSHSLKNENDFIYYPDLNSKLNKIGVIGQTQNGHCILGYCAEPHAANALLRRLNHENFHVTNTSKFVFTKALRVRTHQIVKYCDFCKRTFPQL